MPLNQTIYIPLFDVLSLSVVLQRMVSGPNGHRGADVLPSVVENIEVVIVKVQRTEEASVLVLLARAVAASTRGDTAMDTFTAISERPSIRMTVE